MHSGQIGRIMVRIQSVEIRPRVDDMPLLRIQRGEKRVQVRVPTTFVSIVPDEDAGMVDVPVHHFLEQFRPGLGGIASMPACQFVQVEDTQRVAYVQEPRIRRIMAPDGVHVHLPDQAGVLEILGLGGGPTAFRMETVPVHAFQDDLRPVHVQSVPGTEFHGPEADAFLHSVQNLPAAIQEGNLQVVQVRVFAFPRSDAPPLHLLLITGGKDFLTQAATCTVLEYIAEGRSIRSILRLDDGPQGTVGAGVQGNLPDMGLGHGPQPDRSIDASEEPPVGPSFGIVDGRIVRLLLDEYLQPVGPAVAKQACNPVTEPVEGPPVHFSRHFSVHLDERVGHHPVEDDVHFAALPGAGDPEGVTVQARLLAGLRLRIAEIVPPVGVFSEPLQLPLRRDGDPGPASAARALRAQEIPLDSVVCARSGQVLDLRADRIGGGREGNRQEQRQDEDGLLHRRTLVFFQVPSKKGTSPRSVRASRRCSRPVLNGATWTTMVPAVSTSKGLHSGFPPGPTQRIVLSEENSIQSTAGSPPSST